VAINKHNRFRLLSPSSVKVTYPQPRTHIRRNAITFISWLI